MTFLDVMPYGALVAVAIICAAHVPNKEPRGAALIAASILAMNWVVFVLAYSAEWLGTDIAPASLINDIVGSHSVSHEATWAYADAFAAMSIVLIAFRHWWAYALWALYILQIAQHFSQSIGNGDFGLYSYGLDLIFVAMVAVFILIGGKGTLNHVSRIIGDLSVRGLRSVRYALQRTRTPSGRG